MYAKRMSCDLCIIIAPDFDICTWNYSSTGQQGRCTLFMQGILHAYRREFPHAESLHGLVMPIHDTNMRKQYYHRALPQFTYEFYSTSLHILINNCCLKTVWSELEHSEQCAVMDLLVELIY